jgi:hypothetical protein
MPGSAAPDLIRLSCIAQGAVYSRPPFFLSCYLAPLFKPDYSDTNKKDLPGNIPPPARFISMSNLKINQHNLEEEKIHG